MATPVSTKLSPTSFMIEPPRRPTLTQAGGIEALQARLEQLSQEWHTPEPEIDPDSFPPAFSMQCESIWYFFNGAKLDEARDTIVSELYWRLEFATLFSYWMEQNPVADQMLELASLWCSCATRGWQAIAVVLRNKILGTGLSYNEFKEIRLLCKNEEYFEIEFNHLEPIAERIERNHWLALHERAERKSIYAMERELGLVPQTPPAPPSPPVVPSPPTPPAQPAQPVQPEQPAPAQRRKRQPRQQRQDIPRPNVTTRSQSRKQEGKGGNEPNFLRERKDNDRNDETRNKTMRRKNTSNMGAVEKKTDQKKGRRTGGARKKGSK
ncbi:hypothetical protein F5Y09DRAFT_353581 [Xylaria sp. FL1042]|nr:hypothetical protein F5Y09DRAFT_353581 [Xylaria sp. FL1042]